MSILAFQSCGCNDSKTASDLNGGEVTANCYLAAVTAAPGSTSTDQSSGPHTGDVPEVHDHEHDTNLDEVLAADHHFR